VATAEHRPSYAERKAAAAERLERRGAVDDPAVVMEAAASFLSVRPRSVAETRRRLRHLGYPHALVDTVLERLTEMGYLDDAAFATAWVESRDRSKPRGEGALRRELAIKGVDRETVVSVLEARAVPDDGADPSAPSPDRVAAERLVDRKRSALLRETDPRKRAHKAYALLARNGFAPDVCREVAATLDAAEDRVTED
jgi:regulatory protein